MQTNTVMMPRELTYENGGKYLFHDEFFVEHQEPCFECADLDDEENENCKYCSGTNSVTTKIPIAWTTIKAIYEKAVDKLGV